MSANTLYVAYMLGCLTLFLVVYSFRAFDLRGVSKLRRRRTTASADEDEFVSDGERNSIETAAQSGAIMIIPRADLVAMVSAMTLASVALLAAVGFLGPRMIDQLIADAPIEPFRDWRWTADTPLARVAQVTGALCLGLIALRVVRPLIAMTTLVLASAAIYATINYVLGRPSPF